MKRHTVLDFTNSTIKPQVIRTQKASSFKKNIRCHYNKYQRVAVRRWIPEAHLSLSLYNVTRTVYHTLGLLLKTYDVKKNKKSYKSSCMRNIYLILISESNGTNQVIDFLKLIKVKSNSESYNESAQPLIKKVGKM